LLQVVLEIVQYFHGSLEGQVAQAAQDALVRHALREAQGALDFGESLLHDGGGGGGGM
jgi:hypothetical protein